MGRVFLGRYEPIRLLGEGGMGKVYLARQTDLGRQVVVKVMHDHIAADPKFRERFQRETLLMARFQHPYVVTLYDASLNDPQGPCIVMEYIRGITLDTLLHRNTRLTPARVGRLLNQLCEALQAAHDEGIIHRDLKPANLMVVDPDTPYEKIKVMDFGLAKLFNDSSSLAMVHKANETGMDFAVGTPGYISPEQVRGEEIGFPSDIYSVGVIIFELLTGKLPFQRDETMDVLLAHATDPPPSFESMGAADWASRSVEAVVRSCLAKKPADRPSGARELGKRYEAALFEQFDTEPTEQDSAAGVDTEPLPPRPAPTPVPFDPNTVVHQLQAWMPDVLATCKLRGFVNDMGGEVLESVPGRIVVRLGSGGNGTSWFGLRRKAGTVDMELLLERNDPRQPSQLHITVRMSSPDHRAAASPMWRDRCNSIFCELRGYLAGASVGS
ncbi:MAG: serine/threonine protein kinase [Gemmataceae bacterium]|nr:serine/threonine protein kinase [Gemmataceae bacterium]